MDRDSACRRCRGRGRVLVVRPSFALLCVAVLLALEIFSPWGVRSSGIHSSCTTPIVVVLAALWVACGGLWTACPKCGGDRAMRRCTCMRPVRGGNGGWLTTLLLPVYAYCDPAIREARDPRGCVRVLNSSLRRQAGLWCLLALNLLIGQHVFFMTIVLIAYPRQAIVMQVVYLVLLQLIITGASLHILRRKIRKVIFEVLAAEGHRRCANCGYDLHGLPGSQCPECGEEFQA